MKYLKYLHHLLQFDSYDSVFILILLVGTFLRVWRLESSALFPDFAVTQWGRGSFLATFLLLSIQDKFSVIAFGSAMIQLMSLVLSYFFFKKLLHPISSILIALIFAVSPVMVAYGRMASPTSFLYFFLLVYCITTLEIKRGRSWLITIATGCGTFLVLEHLWFFPILTLVLFASWKKNLSVASTLFFAGLGIASNVAVLLLLRNQIGSGINLPLSTIFSRFPVSAFFSQPKSWALVGFVVMSCILTYILRNRQVSYVLQVSLILFWDLCVSLVFIRHDLPLFLVYLLLPVTLGVASLITELKKPWQQLVISLFFLWAVCCCGFIVRTNFFVDSSVEPFVFGPTLEQQNTIVQWILNDAKDLPVSLATTSPDTSSFDINTYQFLLNSIQSKIPDSTSEAQRLYYINLRESELTTYPGAKITSFEQIDVIQLPSPTSDFSSTPNPSQ